jgi:hypothetical protein
MDNQDSVEPSRDIHPRDQLEYYKVELTRLRAENKRLSGEVDYLRQALAAALSKMPQLETPATPAPTTPEADPNASQPPPRESGRSMETYVRYFSLASLMASPVALLVIVMLGLICAIIFLVSMSLLPDGILWG